jgi:hypothetical protein
MNQNGRRSVRSIVIRLFLLYAALIAIACGIFAIFAVKDGLKTGQVYSLAIVLGSGAKVYRSSSPAEYWFIIMFYIFSGIAGFFVGFFMLIQSVYKLIKSNRGKRDDDR